MAFSKERQIREWLTSFSLEELKPFYEGVFKKTEMTFNEAKAIEIKHKIATEILNKVIAKRAETKSEPLEKPKPVEVNFNNPEETEEEEEKKEEAEEKENDTQNIPE